VISDQWPDSLRFDGVQFDYEWSCDAREIPRPAGENAGLRDDFLSGYEPLPPFPKRSSYFSTRMKSPVEASIETVSLAESRLVP